jgi:hypothetical protein
MVLVYEEREGVKGEEERERERDRERQKLFHSALAYHFLNFKL